MLFAKRLPGLVYTYRYTVFSICILASTFVYFLFKWNILCLNVQALQHVEKMCKLYEDGQAMGSLCAPLCVTKNMHSIRCHSFQADKEAVFSAEWHNIRLVFKSVSNDVNPIHWYDNGVLKYPSEKDFLKTIQTIVKSQLNLTVSYDTSVRLSRLKPSYKEQDNDIRHLEMENLWLLLHDHEYLLSALFTDRDVFPQLLGTCGPYFAVEYLEPVSDISPIFSISDSLKEWGTRLRLAVQIIHLLEELENSFREPFYLCDIKTEHFGLITRGGKLKFIDLDGVLPRSVIDNHIQQVTHCEADQDCEFYDCRSKCDEKSSKCSRTVVNNNLQRVCEKIFLGMRMSNKLIVPGLLMSQHTPAELATILRQCANPVNEDNILGKSADEDLKTRLFTLLSEIEQSVNNDFNR